MNLIPYIGEGFSSNSYLLISNGEAVIIDCSAPSSTVERDLQKSNAVLKYVILTHGHFDHIETLDEIRDLTGAEIIIHQNDAEMLTDSNKNGYSDFFTGEFTSYPADKTVVNGDVIHFGNDEINVIHTPGHSKGSICLQCGECLFTGDTLFANNIGRSDLYGGDEFTIMKSLKLLSNMDPKLVIYPGHGPASTMERELRCNYYIRDALEM